MAIGTITVRVAKVNADRTYDWESLPESTRAFIADYGFKQWLADAHAPCVRRNYETEAAWLADVVKRVGERDLMARSGTIGVGSPNKAELLRLANEARDAAEKRAQNLADQLDRLMSAARAAGLDEDDIAALQAA
jgi:hypothetical protein